jgi:hypothetical protein
MKCAVNDRQTRYVARRQSLIFCWQLSEPSSFRRFSRRFGRRPPAKNLAAFIEDFSLVSAAPKLHPVQPSPVDTRSLHLCHTRCLTRRCDLNIAVPPGKLPQAAQRTPKERGKKTMRRFCTFAWQCNLGRFIRRQASYPSSTPTPGTQRHQCGRHSHKRDRSHSRHTRSSASSSHSLVRSRK